jgi:hypothetical protein
MVFPQVYKALRYSAIVLGVILAVMFSVMIRKDRTSRFFAFGAVVSLLPICATMPSDRLLYFVGIGAMGLIAQFLGMVFGGKLEMPRLRSYRVGAAILGGIFVFVHLIVSPVSMAVRSSMPIGPKELFASISPSEPLDAGVEHQDLILVNPMDSLLCQFAPIRWAGRGEPVPRRMRILVSSIGAPVKVFRRDDRTIVVRPESGFMSSRMDWIFRSPEERFALGDKVELDGMTAEIIELCEKCGNPAAVAFGFDAVLEDDSLRWVKWERGEFVEFIPPAVGEEVTIYSDFEAVIRDYFERTMPF